MNNKIILIIILVSVLIITLYFNLYKIIDSFGESIPNTIYFCNKTLDKMELYANNWKKLNPEYEIKLYDDKMCREFLLNEYSQLHLDIFNFLEDGEIKADFWRVCILNKYFMESIF